MGKDDAEKKKMEEADLEHTDYDWKLNGVVRSLSSQK